MDRLVGPRWRWIPSTRNMPCGRVTDRDSIGGSGCGCSRLKIVLPSRNDVSEKTEPSLMVSTHVDHRPGRRRCFRLVFRFVPIAINFGRKIIINIILLLLFIIAYTGIQEMIY